MIAAGHSLAPAAIITPYSVSFFTRRMLAWHTHF
jgi:hypothetical protein